MPQPHVAPFVTAGDAIARGRLIADLSRIAERFRFTAERIGAPGCRVRQEAAQDEAAIRAAIRALTEAQP